MDGFGGFLVICFIAVVYLAPTLVAYSRKHTNSDAILVLNLLTGWTLIGWVAAAVWCSTNSVQK